MTTARPSAVAYIYDRHIDQKTDSLKVRLDACIAYIEANRWQIAGFFLDKGADALSLNDRPALHRLCNTMRADAYSGRLCVVYEWERFALDRDVRDALMRRVLAAGGSLQTIRGQRLSPDGMLANAPSGAAWPSA